MAAVLANRQQLDRRETCKGFVRKIEVMVVVYVDGCLGRDGAYRR